MSSATYYFCVQPFPSLKLFNIGSTLSAFIWLSHLYSKIPPLSELVEPTSRFYWSFSSAPGRWFEGGVPPKSIQLESWGWAGLGGPRLVCPPLCDCCHPLSVHRWHLNHATFTCLLIHKYTNTQIHKCLDVMSTFILYLSVCLVFRICIDCICISCTFDLLSFNPFGMFVFLEIRPKRQHSSQ